VKKILAATNQSPQTLYVEWLMVDNTSSLLFAVSKGSVRGFELPAGRDQIAKLGRQWRSSFAPGVVRGVRPAEAPKRADAALESESAAQIYTAVFGPLIPELRKGAWSHLVLVPDGPLLDLPFAGLLDGQKARLIENFPLTTAISVGSVFSGAARRKSNGGLLAIGDPLEPGEERVVAPEGGRYGSLANARAEAKTVSGLFPNSAALMGKEAREQVVKQRLDQYQIVHFATHGILSRSDGLQSGLLLANEGSDSSEDGILQAWEIADIPIAAQLAVLSACDTAEGDERLGEGLMGLAWAFQAAGSPNVLASLWSIDDEATRNIMTEFYRLLRNGARIDDALRSAMLSLKNKPGNASPYYWAGFRSIGPAGTITLPR
jgi:CHAT domain-containing protein